MPTYRLTTPGQPPGVLDADTCRREGAHTVLRGTALVINRPREIVLRRVPASVVDVIDDAGRVDDVAPAVSGPQMSG